MYERFDRLEKALAHMTTVGQAAPAMPPALAVPAGPPQQLLTMKCKFCDKAGCSGHDCREGRIAFQLMREKFNKESVAKKAREAAAAVETAAAAKQP